MTLEEFKFIYDMEYYHRTLGRFIGALFLVKAVSFTMSRSLNAQVLGRLWGLMAMITGQGLLGWYCSAL